MAKTTPLRQQRSFSKKATMWLANAATLAKAKERLAKTKEAAALNMYISMR